MMKKIALIVPVLLLFNMQLHSQSIITDRPDQTESSFALPKGAFQIESGILLNRYEGYFPVKEISHPSTLFRYGLVKNLELRIVHSYNSIEIADYYNKFRTSGMGDIELGAKLQFLGNQSTTTQMALLSHLVTPSGSVYFSEHGYSSINRLLVSHSFKNFSLGYNIGFNYSDPDENYLTYTLALSKSINDHFSIFVEPFGELYPKDSYTLNIGGGFAYLLNNKMQLDFAFGTGIVQEMNFLTIGFSVLFVKNEEEQ